MQDAHIFLQVVLECLRRRPKTSHSCRHPRVLLCRSLATLRRKNCVYARSAIRA